MMNLHSKWYPLSPYFLKDDNGCIMENIWQFSKVYRDIPQFTQCKSRYDKTIVWNWPSQQHLSSDKLLPEYFARRKPAMKNVHPVRYPVWLQPQTQCSWLP